MRTERFDIDGALLAGPAGDPRWNNLGVWSGAADYTAACRAMARRHGEAAGLTAGAAVLELGCGWGAALDCWREEFAAARLGALERRPHCVAALARQHDEPDGVVVQGRFDEPLPAALARQTFDAVLCVDAAYHARSLQAFVATARAALQPGGRLVFTTLGRAPGRAGPPRLALQAAAIPAASVLTPADICATLIAGGFVEVQLFDLSAEVYPGFAAWVRHRAAVLPQVRKLTPAWWKIRLTGWLCERLARDPTLAYVLVRATAAAAPTSLADGPVPPSALTASSTA